jgi:ATP-dependent Clp protease ATP-binding subunit ClpX
MSKVQDAPAVLRCSFCNKEHAHVKKLIAGNTGVAICDECVEVCNDIIADKVGRPSSSHEYEPIDEPPELFPFKCPKCGHAWKAARK